METVRAIEKLSNGNTIEYDRHPTGTCFHIQTPIEIRTALDKARETRSRVRIFYGNTVSGKDWFEEYSVSGYVGQSTGSIKIPLIIHNSRSLGGPDILDHCIVRMIVDGKEVYRHPNYTANFEIVETEEKLPFCVLGNGTHIANFETRQKAERWTAFMKGNRGCK